MLAAYCTRTTCFRVGILQFECGMYICSHWFRNEVTPGSSDTNRRQRVVNNVGCFHSTDTVSSGACLADLSQLATPPI